MSMINKAKDIIAKALTLGRFHLATDKAIANRIFEDLKDAGYLNEMLIKDEATMEQEVIKAREAEEEITAHHIDMEPLVKDIKKNCIVSNNTGEI